MDQPPDNQASKNSGADKVDEELSQLLDNSLQDFGKPGAKTPENVSASGEVSLDTLGVAPSSDQEAAQQAVIDFQNLIRQMTDMQKVMSEHMNVAGVAETPGEGGEAAAAAVAVGAGPEEAQFAEMFLQNLKFMTEKAQKIQEAGNEEELDKAIRDLQSDSEYENEFLPFMQGLMSSLLSKDTLYPSLKEMSVKYPPWLEQNREKTDPASLERYEGQLRLIQEAVKEFEEEKEDDPDDVKGQRFERVLIIMQKMQACGQPPEDLVGAPPPGWSFNEQGIPQMVDQEKAAEACSIM